MFYPKFDTFKPISLNPNKTQQNLCLNPDFFIGKIFVLTFLRIWRFKGVLDSKCQS